MSKYSEITSLLDFIKRSPDAYIATGEIAARLIENGYTELYENEAWTLESRGKYFVRRGGSSLIAFRMNEGQGGFVITATHSDSPSFKIKLDSEPGGAYARFSTEKYGGMNYATWLDRPLSVCGRVCVKSRCGVEFKALDFARAIALIPSVAIHMNRTVNDGYKYNPATDLLPLYSLSNGKGIRDLVADELGVNGADIVSADLTLYCIDEGKVIGVDEELVLSPRLDDLACVYACLTGFLVADAADCIPVLAVFDNEEVGSATKQGAASSFLYDVLLRVSGGYERYVRLSAGGFMVSADNAHALHPNHPELADPANAPLLGGGVVIKHNASQRYTTDAVSEAAIKAVAEKAGVKLQSYYNRADIPGGSTLGSISNTRVAVSTVDIGIPQLAMHSATETVASSDIADMIRLIKALYSSEMNIGSDGISVI